MNWPALASQVATSLVEAGLMAADRKGAGAAVILAQLRASPPDIAKDYEAAKAALLGDKDEVLK